MCNRDRWPVGWRWDWLVVLRVVVSCLVVTSFCGQAVGQGESAQSQGVALDPAQLATAGRLDWEDDIASRMVEGIDTFLQRQLHEAPAKREQFWRPDYTSPELYRRSVEPNRQALAKMVGIVEARVNPVSMQYQSIFAPRAVGGTQASMVLPAAASIGLVRWPVLEDPDPLRSLVSVWGEGLLMAPHESVKPVADVLLIPDCDQGLSSFLDDRDKAYCTRLARELVALNCRVLVPLTISRKLQQRGGRAVLTHREFVYRTSFVLGRHLVGYETQKVLSAVDWFCDQSPSTAASQENLALHRPVIVIGAGEGGRIGLLAAALDERIDGLWLSSGFGSYEAMWREPIDRNLFGFLRQFGGAELLRLVAPRPVWINHRPWPRQELLSQDGGAPGVVEPISVADGHAEVECARQLVGPWIQDATWSITETDTLPVDADASIPSATIEPQQLRAFLDQCLGAWRRSAEASEEAALTTKSDSGAQVNLQEATVEVRLLSPVGPASLDDSVWQQRAVEELDRHNQLVLREASFERESFMQGIATGSLADFEVSTQTLRDTFRQEVIGSFDQELLPPAPRVRQSWEDPKWIGTEVVLDVFPDVIAYGVLLLPKNLQAGERRPVVVCQHGLEGRPTDTFLGDHPAYHNFAARLAEQGYIVFAPQNPYLFGDRFRSLQRKANPLGKTLFSVIVPQHQQLLNWLKTLPCVDGERIAFYGLSYGGKSAMRIPALVTDYCLSICSADFNEWVVKNASTRDSFSYVWTNEYEIFEWNLGSTFNYAEMAALICPRPFMVERGHFDGVGTDAWVAHEYAKVRHLYAGRLKIPERTRIEWFDGPHTIHGEGTFEFLGNICNGPNLSACEPLVSVGTETSKLGDSKIHTLITPSSPGERT